MAWGCRWAGLSRLRRAWVSRSRGNGSHACIPTGQAASRLRTAPGAALRSRFRFRYAWLERRSMNMPTADPIRVLVADDEVPARQRLIDLLRRDAQVASIAEAADGQTAAEMIQSQRPDLIFLDVQMPEMDGLEVIDAIGAAQMPLTVFVTAYDQHAIRAFEASALDYLLKPFSDERFEATMTRVKTRLDDRSMKEFGQRVMKMVSAAPVPAERRLARLVVKSGGTTRFIRAADIDWIEAAGGYGA